jgi:hypothetical protein
MAESSAKTTTFLGHIKWGAAAATAVVLLSLLPQLHLWLVRGPQWQGAYATLQGDEFLYSAYINALIDGRPRRNDPFAGRDSTPTSPLPESTFSIQFIPSFVIAKLARACGASASSAFIALLGVAGLLASISIYWLLASITGDRNLSAAGVMFVLCFGAFAGGQGIIGLLLRPGVVFLGLPFLRRYQPVAAFPLFFIFCVLIWQALKLERRRSRWFYASVAGLTLAVLVFSYIYLWTAAAAWLACLALLWFSLRPKRERLRALGLFITTAAIAILALIPYANLVLHRAANLDEAQTLFVTHRPDPFRVPEMIGVLILIALLRGVRRGDVMRNDPRLIFAASFALLPLVLFNQQVLTGRSMQPYHFEAFVANYAVLVGLIILTALLYQPIKHRRLLWIAALCFLWGVVEVTMPVLANYGTNIAADEMVPVLLRLKELSKQDGTFSSLRDQGRTSTLVFSPQRDVMGMLPTWAPQGTLLGMGGLDFGSASQLERKELLYIWLYYSAADAGRLREILNGRSEDTFLTHYARIAMFGHEREVPMLSFHFEPIRQDEIEAEVRAYQAYADSCSREKVLLHQLTYVVARVEGESDLSHVDLWYERDAGERIGDYNLYRLKLRK